MTAIEVAGLVKRYRAARHNAVDGISFQVASGEFCCLLGPNGAGKTTTISILTTTLRQTSGVVRIAGPDVSTDQAGVRRQIGVVFQQPALDQNLTAEENLRLHAVLYGLYPWRPLYRLMPAAYRTGVQQAAGILGMSGRRGSRCGRCRAGSGAGWRLSGRSCSGRRVLFLDEPTAGLDPESRRSLWTYLGEARATFGTTILLTTHYLEEAESADAACVIVAGRIVDRGSPAELRKRQGAGSLEEAYLGLVGRHQDSSEEQACDRD